MIIGKYYLLFNQHEIENVDVFIQNINKLMTNINKKLKYKFIPQSILLSFALFCYQIDSKTVHDNLMSVFNCKLTKKNILNEFIKHLGGSNRCVFIQNIFLQEYSRLNKKLLKKSFTVKSKLKTNQDKKLDFLSTHSPRIVSNRSNIYNVAYRIMSFSLIITCCFTIASWFINEEKMHFTREVFSFISGSLMVGVTNFIFSNNTKKVLNKIEENQDKLQ